MRHANKKKTPGDVTSITGQSAKDAWQAAIGFCYDLSIHDYPANGQITRLATPGAVQRSPQEAHRD